jgi:hypothetical protein
MTMSKKSTTKKSTPKKAPRMSASAARADGAAKTKRALAEAKAATDANLKAIAAADQENAAKREERASASDGMTKSERAIAASKKSKATKTAKQATSNREPKAKRVSGLDLAAKVLASAREPLNAKTIAERAVAAGWKTSGKTPHATLYAAMIREIAAKGKDARFRKTDRGLFASSGKGA